LYELLSKYGLIDFLNLKEIDFLPEGIQLYEKFQNELFVLPIQNMDQFNNFLNIAVALRNEDVALSDIILKKLEQINLGHGGVFTHQIFNSFVKNNIDVFQAGGISCKSLGSYGRFGNQIIQYMTLWTLANLLGLKMFSPTWIGDYLFQISPSTQDKEFEIIESELINEILNDKITARNFDIGVYLPKLRQFNASRSMLCKHLKFRSEFDFSQDLIDYGFNASKSLVVHLRLTDFIANGKFSDVEFLSNWLSFNLEKLGCSEIWVVSDSEEGIDYLKKSFDIKTLLNMNKRYKEFDFLYEWQLLRLSQYNVINGLSTFSLTATYLNNNKQVSFSQFGQFISPTTW